jgi:hypothetical protein
MNTIRRAPFRAAWTPILIGSSEHRRSHGVRIALGARLGAVARHAARLACVVGAIGSATTDCSGPDRAPAASENPAGVGTAGQALTPTTQVPSLDVSFRGAVDSLIASTGNLYWTTSNRLRTSVWRAGKSNIAGQEIELYGENDTSTHSVKFKNFVYAHTSDFFGYFVSDTFDNSVRSTAIKRVPLVGGAAVTLATLPAGFVYDLATDQSTTLFWTDASGLHEMPIDGGPITNLFSGSATYLGLDATNVYFASDKSLMRVPKAGGTAVQVVSTPDFVSALYVDAAGSRIYWADGGGIAGSTGTAVRSAPTAGGAIATYQQPRMYWLVNGVGSDGTRVFWTQCGIIDGILHSCVLSQFSSGVATDTSEDFALNSGFGDVQWDASSVFFASDFGVRRTCVGANFGIAACGCDPLATTCWQKQCGPATNNCRQAVTCPNTCAPPAQCGSPVSPNVCCTSTGNPCGDQCAGTATDNCGNVFTCSSSCGLNGQCPCAGGRCDPTSNFCDCSSGPCF